MKSETRRTIKSILNPLGLEGAARSLYRSASGLRDRWVMARYRNASHFEAVVDGATLRFSLEDPYSRSWFLPRYAGGRLHERSVTLLMGQHLKQSRCFADVGTNLGWFTCLASALMRDGQIYGFEMDDQNIGLLRRNLVLNGCDNAVVHHAAVSDAPGTVSYNRDADEPSSVLRISPEPGAQLSIRSISLDDFFGAQNTAPDLIKIDVEGAEMKVLEGAAGLLERAAPTLFVEIHPENLPEFGSSAAEVLAFLTSRGYSTSQIVDLREQRDDVALEALAPGAAPRDNCMVYARPPGSR